MLVRGQIAQTPARCGVTPRAPRTSVSFHCRIACQRPDQDLSHDQVASSVASRLRPCGAHRSRPAGRCGQHAAGTPGQPAGRATRHVGPGPASAPPIGAGAEPAAAAGRPAPAPSAHGTGLSPSAPRPRRHGIRYRPFPGRPMPTRPGSLRGFGPSARPQQCGRAFLFLWPQAPKILGASGAGARSARLAIAPQTWRTRRHGRSRRGGRLAAASFVGSPSPGQVALVALAPAGVGRGWSCASSKDNKPCSKAAGVGGQPGMTRSTGSTAPAPPSTP